MSEFKLHEISQSFSKLKDLLENEEDVNEYLEAVDMQLQEKAKNIFFFMQNYQNNNNQINEEMKRLQGLKKTYSSHYNRLKDYVAFSMGNAGIKSIESDLVKFSFRKSKSVVIEDQAKLKDEFLNVKYTPNKTAIKEAIKGGAKVEGASIIENNLLQIK